MPRGDQEREELVATPLSFSHSPCPLAAPSAAKQMALINQEGWVQITRRSHHTTDPSPPHSNMKSFGHTQHTQPHQEPELH